MDENRKNDESIVKNKSDFIPDKSNEENLEKFITNISNEPLSPKEKQNIKRNISHAQRKALNDLKDDDDIIIKPADKGGATIIMDKNYYESEINKLLGNTDFYKQLDDDPYKKVKKDYEKLITNYKNGLTEDKLDYLIKFERKESKCYGLPKIHKSKEISEQCKTNENTYIEISVTEGMTFRPIVAGPENETHRLSNFIDILLKPMVKHVKSFIRDSTDFLNHLPKTVSPDSYLVSFDIENLYSNITHQN